MPLKSVVRACLDRASGPEDTARCVQAGLRSLGMFFEDSTLHWLTLLVAKWTRKTPDLEEQAAQIARRVLEIFH